MPPLPSRHGSRHAACPPGRAHAYGPERRLPSALRAPCVRACLPQCKVLVSAGVDLTAAIEFESGAKPIMEVVNDKANDFKPEVRALFDVSKSSAAINKAIQKGEQARPARVLVCV